MTRDADDAGWGIHTHGISLADPDLMHHVLNQLPADWYGVPDWHGALHVPLSDEYLITWVCPCDGPTRPVTVSLARTVADLVDLPLDARASHIPDAWLVAQDRRLADGDTSPVAVWWTTFFDWVFADVLPASSSEELTRVLAHAFAVR